MYLKLSCYNLESIKLKFQLSFFMICSFAFWFFSFVLLQDEWVISRVFQKSTGSIGTAATSTGGGKKRLSSSINMYQEVSSPSSISHLPALLDSSPYSTTATSAAAVVITDRDHHSFKKEHVPCFSTNATATTTFDPTSVFDISSNNLHALQPTPSFSSILDSSPTNFSNYTRNSNFPSLRSLHDNLQLPFFSGGSSTMHGGFSNPMSNWTVPETQKVEQSELDCMWSYWVSRCLILIKKLI